MNGRFVGNIDGVGSALVDKSTGKVLGRTYGRILLVDGEHVGVDDPELMAIKSPISSRAPNSVVLGLDGKPSSPIALVHPRSIAFGKALAATSVRSFIRDRMTPEVPAADGFKIISQQRTARTATVNFTSSGCAGRLRFALRDNGTWRVAGGKVVDYDDGSLYDDD